MLPPTTSWPPNFFTPRRRPAESRPLRELPPAFLCAISNYLLLLVGLLGGRLLRRGLLGRSLLVRGLRTRAVLDRRGLLGLGFLHHVDALGGLGRLGLRGRLGRCLGLGSLGGLRSFRRLGRSVLLRRGLLLGLAVADRDDAEQGHLLAVPGLAAIVVPAALLEDDDLLALRLGDDLGRDDDLGGLRHVVAVAGEQDVAQGDRVAGVTRQLLDRDLVSGGDAILLAARAHYCEHGLQIRSLSTVVLRVSPLERQKRRPSGHRKSAAVRPTAGACQRFGAPFSRHPPRWKPTPGPAKAHGHAFQPCLPLRRARLLARRLHGVGQVPE